MLSYDASRWGNELGNWGECLENLKGSLFSFKKKTRKKTKKGQTDGNEMIKQGCKNAKKALNLSNKNSVDIKKC